MLGDDALVTALARLPFEDDEPVMSHTLKQTTRRDLGDTQAVSHLRAAHGAPGVNL